MWLGVGSGPVRSQHKVLVGLGCESEMGSVAGVKGALREHHLPSPRLGQASHHYSCGQGRLLCSRRDRPLTQETQEGPSITPLPFALPPSPSDKPPVPHNQVSLLHHACSAELDQLL